MGGEGEPIVKCKLPTRLLEKPSLVICVNGPAASPWAHAATFAADVAPLPRKNFARPRLLGIKAFPHRIAVDGDREASSLVWRPIKLFAKGPLPLVVE